MKAWKFVIRIKYSSLLCSTLTPELALCRSGVNRLLSFL
uniref:Uncharacterized protein n=1 Tax=Rhizophora mucronata TaxID=61149 RepID=A0A2P2QFL0_RHIMU